MTQHSTRSTCLWQRLANSRQGPNQLAACFCMLYAKTDFYNFRQFSSIERRIIFHAMRKLYEIQISMSVSKILLTYSVQVHSLTSCILSIAAFVWLQQWWGAGTQYIVLEEGTVYSTALDRAAWWPLHCGNAYMCSPKKHVQKCVRKHYAKYPHTKKLQTTQMSMRSWRGKLPFNSCNRVVYSNDNEQTTDTKKTP